MSAIPMLDDDEKYLAAILDDPSGIELAEFCIKEGTLVLTRRGHVPIQNVLVGDEVLTHRGRWRRVTAVLDRGVRDVVTLKGVGLPGITMTADHRLYARKARQGLRSVEGHRDVFLMEPEWLEAGEAEFGGAGRVRNTRYATPRVVEALGGETATPERAWLLGRWIADGSKSHTPGRGYVISWAIRDRDLADFKVRLKSAGFERATVTATHSAYCWNVIVYSKELHNWLPQGRAESKTVPTWVLGAEEHLRQQVLDGYLSGDGYWSGENWQASTVSPALAHDLRVLAATLGWSVSLSVLPGGQRSKFGGTVEARELWSLTMTDDGGWTTTDDLHQWSMLKSRVEAGRAHVWDLSVEGDHSFVAAGVVVHNCWIDEEKEDRCFRLWDYQYKWYSDDATFQIDQAGRSLGKSVGITMRAFAFPFNFPGQEMLITAPELNHLRPITDKVENLFLQIRLGREMLPKVKGGGINHQPQFQARFINGSRVISRLPNRDGRGIKGMHPLVLELDEGQDYPEAGWVEIIETMKAGSVGAQWRAHGVSRGVRDTYYRMTQNENPDLPFKVHRYMAPHRPTWSDEERRSKIAIYGGTEDNVDYRRNIFGEHGDAHNPLFVLARLMACVRINENAWASQYNDDIYAKIKINDELHRKSGLPIESFVDLPGNHLSDEYISYWAGADIGYTNDPTEILVWGVVKRRGSPDLLRQLTRIQLQRISANDQADVIREVIRFYGVRLRRFALDKTGNGLPLWQMLRDDPSVGPRIAGYGFSEKKAVEFDDRQPVGRETAKDLVIEKNVIEFACVDEETEILTRRGWMRHDGIVEGEDVLTWDIIINAPAWAPVEKVLRYAGEIPVRRIEHRAFSAVTTLNHRWWVRRAQGDWVWRQTDTLGRFDRVPKAGRVSNLPTSAKYDDDFVEMVAWLWTEGSVMYWGRAATSKRSDAIPRAPQRIALSQSRTANPAKAARIEKLMANLGLVPSYQDHACGVREWHLSKAQSQLFWSVIDGETMAVRQQFLSELTQAQLDLFIQASLDGDGWRTGNAWALSQANDVRGQARIDGFQMACTLAGRATTATKMGEKIHVTVAVRDVVRPMYPVAIGTGAAVMCDEIAPMVWCPRTSSGTWLARRRGTIYYTGNSDELRRLVDTQSIELPYDVEQLTEFQGQSVTTVKDSTVGGVRKRYSGGSFHTLDAARMLVAGKTLESIEKILAEPTRPGPVLDQFFM